MMSEGQITAADANARFQVAATLAAPLIAKLDNPTAADAARLWRDVLAQTFGYKFAPPT